MEIKHMAMCVLSPIHIFFGDIGQNIETFSIEMLIECEHN